MKPRPGAFRLEGAKELEAVIRRLPNKVRGRVLRSGAMAGAREVREAARQAAPVGETATLRDSIAARTQKTGARNGITIRVGPTRAGFYGLFQEFGTSWLPARPWFRPAWEASKGRALNRIGKMLGPAIERAAKRLAGPLARSGLVRRRSRRRR